MDRQESRLSPGRVKLKNLEYRVLTLTATGGVMYHGVGLIVLPVFVGQIDEAFSRRELV